MSSFHRSGPFDSYDDSSDWDSPFSSDVSWIRPPSFATLVLLFWIVVFAVAMFWHRGGNSASPVAESAAEIYPYGVNPYPTSLPVYGYPEFDSAAVYRYFYNLYMKRLQAASSSDSAPRLLRHPAIAAIPKRVSPKQEQHPVSEEPVVPSENEAPALTPPLPASFAAPVERADYTNAHFAQSLNSPTGHAAKAVRLPQSSLPQRALPDQGGSTPSTGTALKVAPVGLPGYESQPMAIPQGTVKSVYPKLEAVIPPSE